MSPVTNYGPKREGHPAHRRLSTSPRLKGLAVAASIIGVAVLGAMIAGLSFASDKSSQPMSMSSNQSSETVRRQSSASSDIPNSVNIPPEFPVAIQWNQDLFEFHQAATLTWSISSSNKPITSYTVIRNGVKVYQGAERRYTDFAIDNGQKYSYKIFAVNSDGKASPPTVYERTLTCEWLGWKCQFRK